MKSIRILKFFTYACVLVLGIVIGIAIRHYHDMPLSAEVNLVDLATLITTVFLAVYIPEVLDHKLQNTRDKKMMLENRITEYQTILKKINMLVQDDGVISQKAYLELRNMLDVSRHKLDTIASLLGYANFKESFDKDIGRLHTLAHKHASLLQKDDVTAGGFSYPDEVQEQEEKLYNELDKAGSLLIIHISDA